MTNFRTFNTEADAVAYNDASFAALVRAHAAGLTNQEMDDHWNLPTKARIPDLPDEQLVGSRFPIYGRDGATGQFNTSSGFTTAWATPRLTAAGTWAVVAYDQADPLAVPEPAWPAGDA